MPRFTKLALSALVLLFLSALLRAQEEPKWQSHGPYGGLIESIQVDSSDPKRVLVYTTTGNFISSDGAKTWKRILLPEDVYYYARAYVFGGKLYCGAGKKLYISEDGLSWKKEAEFDGRIWYVTAEPGQPEKIWCLYRRRPQRGGDEFVAARKDNGKWHTSLMGRKSPTGHHSFTLAVSPVNRSVLRAFLVSPNRPLVTVFASDDGGRTWESWEPEVHIRTTGGVFSRTNARTVYAAGYNQPWQCSLIRSTDGGKTWETIGKKKEIGRLCSIMVHPKTGHLFLGDTVNGLFKTTDEGKTIIALNNGLHNKSISAIAADPTNEEVLYASNVCGLFRSTDSGKSWRWASKGIEGCRITGLATFNHDPKRLLVCENRQGPRISTDGAKTWSPVARDWCSKFGRDFYNLLHGGKALCMQVNTAGDLRTYVSRDAGKTWQLAKHLDSQNYPVGVVSENEMYAVRGNRFLMRSSDGSSWKTIGGPFEIGTFIRWVGKPPGKDYLLVAGETGMVKCEASSGKLLGSVKVPAECLPVVCQPTFDVSNPEVLYWVSRKGDMYRCNLQSQDWVKLYSHEVRDTRFFVCSVVCDPGKKGRLILGYRDGHIAISEDSGKNWKPLKPELPFFQIRHVAVTAKRVLVVAGNGPVYTLDLSKIK